MLDDEVGLVRTAAGDRSVELNVLVQVVDVTADREAAATRLADTIDDLTVADALATPFLALGTTARSPSTSAAASSAGASTTSSSATPTVRAGHRRPGAA